MIKLAEETEVAGQKPVAVKHFTQLHRSLTSYAFWLLSLD
jgi:hypothetical protein